MTLKMVSFLTLGAAFKHLVRMPCETSASSATVSARALKGAGASFAFFSTTTVPAPAHRYQFTLLAFNDWHNVMARWQIALGSCRNTSNELWRAL
jgi:hypothetical protein